MGKYKRLATLLLVCLLTTGLVGCSLTGGTETEEEYVPKDVVVETLEPAYGDIVVSGEYLAYVEPGQQITVFPKTNGEALAVNYSVGDRVEAGAVLVQLDSKELVKQIAKAELSLELAQKKVNQGLEMAEQNLETYIDNTEEGVNAAIVQAQAMVENAEKQLQSAQLGLTTARRNLREHRDLDEDEYLMTAAAAAATYDQRTDQLRDMQIQAELAVEAAQLGLEQAKTSLEITMIQVQDQEESITNNVKTAELNTDLSDQNLAISQMKDDLSYYSVTAPIGGTIEQRNIDQHDMASVQSPLFVISNLDMMSITFKVPEATLEYIEIGDAITVDKNGATCTGIVTEIATMVDTGGLFTVKASVENPPFSLHTGATVKVYADNQKAVGVMTLPTDALYYEGGKAYVFAVKDGYAKKLYVETGIFNADTVQITSGISSGDRIISTWNANLEDGIPVKLASEQGQVVSSPDEGGDDE